jgi:hypothetical protein
MHDIASYQKVPMLAKREMLTHFSCSMLAEHATNGSRLNCACETRACARKYGDILQYFDNHLMWKYFQEYH